jgi:DNA-binding SARP family transcriptional activator/DNA-binding XRE family transcriptional regulator/Tfp pilus assembly protein PilF
MTDEVLSFKVLGPWEVRRGSSVVAVPHGRLTVLCASLLLSIDEPVSVDTLTERLWPDRAPERPRETIHTYVNRLRNLLGRDAIETGPGGGYRLHLDAANVDLHRFRALVAQSRHAGSTERERELLRDALKLWRGKPFGDVESAWLDRDVVPRLTEEWLTATERRIDLDLAAGPPGTVVAELRELTSAHPTRESLWFRLVLALHRAGRRADALDAYQEAQTVFEEELGVEPGEQLVQLNREILLDAPTPPPSGSARDKAPVPEPEVDDAGTFGDILRAHRTRLSWTQAELAALAEVSERTVHGLESDRTRPRPTTARMLADALGLGGAELERFVQAANRSPKSGPPASPGVPATVEQPESPKPPIPAQLPPDVGDFTGRATELAALDAFLPVTGDTAVVVLSGTAGVGKTALAVRWAHRVAAAFPDGQLYANLRGFAPGQPVPPVEALAEFVVSLGVPAGQIPPKQDAAAALYRSLLAGRRMLVVLDNALDADQVRPLLPSGAGSLVLVTSRHTLSGLVVSHGAQQQTLAPLSAVEATELVTRILGVDRVAAEPDAAAGLIAECSGLPLALRIAAANVRVDQHLDIGEYVAELRAGDRLASLAVDGDPAASVRAAFDWSYERLSAPVQRLFRRLGMVPGPDVTPEAAAALTATDPGQTRRWLRSLADAHLLDRSAPHRYVLHDLLRAYAAERAQAVDPESDRDSAVERLLGWYLRGAVAATEVLAPTMLRLRSSLPETGPAVVRPKDVAEAGEWLAAERRNLVAAVVDAAANGRHEPAWLLADALRGYFETTGNRVDWTIVAQTALAAASADGDPAARSAAASSLAQVHHSGGEFDAALEQVTNALTLARQAGWAAGEARALNHLAILRAESGDLDTCVELLQAALELDRRSGDRGGEAKRLMNLGVATQSAGRLREALDYLRQAVDLLGAQVHADLMLANLGHLQHHTGDLDAAGETLRRAVAAHAENGTQRAFSLVQLAELCLDRGRPAEAEAHVEAAEAIASQSGDRVNGFWVTNMRAYVDLRLGRPQPAMDRMENLLGEADDQGYLSVRCSALASLAEARRHLGQFDLALSNAEQSIKLAETAGRRLLESEARSVRAAVCLARYRRNGSPVELDEATAEAGRVLEMQRWMGHRVGEARTLILLGDIGDASGEADQASRHWRSALELCVEIGLSDSDEVRARLAR